MSWQPLLHGDLRDRACESVQAILDDLSQPGSDPAGEFSLAGGISGRAILHGYQAQSERRRDHAAVANRLLQRAIVGIMDHPGTASPSPSRPGKRPWRWLIAQPTPVRPL